MPILAQEQQTKWRLLTQGDPGKTAARLEEVKARKAAEARAKLAKDAARLLRSANAGFRLAERASEEDVERLRAEGEERLEELTKIDPDAWPWAQWAWAAREAILEVNCSRSPGDRRSPAARASH